MGPSEVSPEADFKRRNAEKPGPALSPIGDASVLRAQEFRWEEQMPSTPLPVAGDDVAEPTQPSFAPAERFEWGNDRAPTLDPPPPLAPVVVGPAPHDRAAAPDAPVASSTVAPTPLACARPQTTWWWIAALGGVGFAAGFAAAALFASDMGYDWRLAAQIGALGGVASGAIGAMIPPVARAIGWAVVAAGSAAVGGTALWLLSRIAPAFVERVLELLR